MSYPAAKSDRAEQRCGTLQLRVSCSFLLGVTGWRAELQPQLPSPELLRHSREFGTPSCPLGDPNWMTLRCLQTDEG